MTEQKRRGGGGRKPPEGRVMSQDAGQRDMSRLGELWKQSESEVSPCQRGQDAEKLSIHKDQRKDSNSRAWQL